jgi:hypothetical protein
MADNYDAWTLLLVVGDNYLKIKRERERERGEWFWFKKEEKYDKI